MNRTRRKTTFLAVTVALCLLWCTACQGEQGGAFTVVTSFYPMYILTLNVTQGVPGVTVHNMAAPDAGCLHDYQLLAGDLRTLSEADALVVNGAGMEAFLDKAQGQFSDLRVVEASQGIALLAAHEEDLAEGHHADDGHDHEANAHVWVDPRNAAKQTRNIAQGLGALDPDHAALYAANAEAYATRLEALYAQMQEELVDLPHRNIVTFHEAFAYFAEAFDLHVAAVIEREPGSEPGTRELAELVDAIRAAAAPALFVEPQYPDRVADILSRETGAKVFTLDPVVTGPMTLTAYEEAMTRNLAALKEALQ